MIMGQMNPIFGEQPEATKPTPPGSGNDAVSTEETLETQLANDFLSMLQGVDQEDCEESVSQTILPEIFIDGKEVVVNEQNVEIPDIEVLTIARHLNDVLPVSEQIENEDTETTLLETAIKTDIPIDENDMAGFVLQTKRYDTQENEIVEKPIDPELSTVAMETLTVENTGEETDKPESTETWTDTVPSGFEEEINAEVNVEEIKAKVVESLPETAAEPELSTSANGAKPMELTPGKPDTQPTAPPRAAIPLSNMMIQKPSEPVSTENPLETGGKTTGEGAGAPRVLQTESGGGSDEQKDSSLFQDKSARTGSGKAFLPGTPEQKVVFSVDGDTGNEMDKSVRQTVEIKNPETAKVLDLTHRPTTSPLFGEGQTVPEVTDKEAPSPTIQHTSLKSDVAPVNTQDARPVEVPNPRSVVSQIVEKAVLHVKKDKTEFKISLKPEFLGRLNMQISSENRKVVVKIFAETPMVKEALENNFHQIRSELKTAGLEVEKIEIQYFNESGRDKGRHDSADHMFSNRGASDTFSDESETPPDSERREDRTGTNEDSGGVDYFA